MTLFQFGIKLLFITFFEIIVVALVDGFFSGRVEVIIPALLIIQFVISLSIIGIGYPEVHAKVKNFRSKVVDFIEQEEDRSY